MPDREKVINGLESCVISTTKCFFNRNEMCPYASVDVLHCELEMMCDALALLKEQQEQIEDMKTELEVAEENRQLLLKEQEAKTGHWVSVNDEDVVAMDNDGCPERACYCSECQKYLIASDEYAVYGKYCPFCGAKMEGR